MEFMKFCCLEARAETQWPFLKAQVFGGTGQPKGASRTHAVFLGPPPGGVGHWDSRFHCQTLKGGLPQPGVPASFLFLLYCSERS